MITPAAFQYSEALFAQETGNSRQDVKFCRDRNLTEGVDWKKVGGEIALAASGVKKLWRRLERRPFAFDLERCVITVKKNGAAAPLSLLAPVTHNAPRTMRVSDICPNPRVVLAIYEDKDRGARPLTFTVDVGTNVNFVVGDVIQAVPHTQQPGFWRYVGTMPGSRRRVQGRMV